ncbi:MAG: hypothetical protein NC343_02445 [Muribaculum sp.]|nr:hypothetical protein [Muribaculaceae bacterium]MCM1080586.1 hypothetical protein [Muribaculum sp.]
MKTKKNSRKWIFLLAVLALVVAAIAAQAKTERLYKSTPSQHIGVQVDSIDFRPDVTRIYLKLIGRPHTSQRIDQAALHVGNVNYQALDIDGVDFNRWFQWEDDGIIPVELDFRSMSKFNNATLEFKTPRGTEKLQITK